MNTPLKNLLTLLCLIVLALPACLSAGGAPPADESDSANAIATGVAATLAAAGQAQQAPDTAAPPPSPTWTIHPTVTASPPEANFSYAGVSFYFNDLLADDITAGVNPGQYDENNLLWSYPEHRSYLFNGWVLSDTFLEPRIRVYPVEDFRAINENVSAGFDGLQAALAAEPLNRDGLRVVDIFNAAQMYQSNPKALRFQNGYGARWLCQYGQAAYPIGWPQMFYTYQGFTDDGLYYISIFFPATHPSLPDPDSVTMDNAFYENYQTYVAEIESQLDGETDNSFLPSLVLLDQLVASLTVGNP